LRLISVALVACVVAAAASASSGVRVSFLGQSHSAPAGSAWAYYVRAQQDGRPWRGTLIVEVQTPKGRVVDHVGRFPFTGSWLAAYLWNPNDRGLFDFKVTFSQNSKTVASALYPVRLT